MIYWSVETKDHVYGKWSLGLKWVFRYILDFYLPNDVVSNAIASVFAHSVNELNYVSWFPNRTDWISRYLKQEVFNSDLIVYFKLSKEEMILKYSNYISGSKYNLLCT